METNDHHIPDAAKMIEQEGNMRWSEMTDRQRDAALADKRGWRYA